ncbi:dienelactone hydrolase family protein [Streptomyces sp. NPDC020412]|uniref:dienelactone hydrolase family protein n=1 Tax=Streptomyces sp. NPDC020412 TaxID=3365073 RepID=UPI0037A94403
MVAVHGGSVDVRTPDGTADAYLAHPDGGGPHPAVLVFSDAFGLREHVRKMADRLASHGYTVLVPNLFHRQGSAPVVALPDFIDGQRRQELLAQLLPLIQSLGPEPAMRDAGAHVDWLCDSPLTADGPVGVVGYCLGANLALRTAGTFPDRVAAVAGFHGSNLAADDEQSPHLLAGAIRAEAYFGHADQDRALPTEQIDRLEAALESAGVRHRTEVYPGAHHGFTQADTDAYDRASDERHWSELIDLFDRALKQRN